MDSCCHEALHSTASSAALSQATSCARKLAVTTGHGSACMGGHPPASAALTDSRKAKKLCKCALSAPISGERTRSCASDSRCSISESVSSRGGAENKECSDQLGRSKARICPIRLPRGALKLMRGTAGRRTALDGEADGGWNALTRRLCTFCRGGLDARSPQPSRGTQREEAGDRQALERKEESIAAAALLRPAQKRFMRPLGVEGRGRRSTCL